MNCSMLENLLYDYLTGRLDEERTRAVKKHIESCKDCKDQVETFKKTIEVLDQWEPPELPEQSAEKLTNRIFESESRPRMAEGINFKKILQKILPPVRFHFPVQAMAAVIIAVSAVVVYNQRKQPDISEPIPRKLVIESENHNVATPLTVRVENIDQAFEKIKMLVDQAGGHLVRRMPEEETLTIVFWISPEKEPILLKQLREKGYEVTQPPNYKDEIGNLHLKLKKIEIKK